MFPARLRSSDSRLPTERVTYVHTNTEGVESPPYTYGSLQNYVGESKQIIDQPHPNYSQKRSRGELVLGDLYLTKWSRSFTPADFHYGEGTSWGTEHCWGDLAGWIESRVSDPYPWFSSDVDQAGKIAHAKARAAMNSAPLLSGEIIGSMADTIGMLKRPFKSSLKLLGKMKTHRLKRLGKTAESAARATADTWLEYRYGWQPLILDGRTTVRLVQEERAKLKRRLVARGSENISLNKTVHSEPAGGIPRCDSVSLDTRFQYNGRASAGVIYEVTPQDVPIMVLQSLGLLGRDIPSTLWELMPFSFVLDWFVNVGDWLQAVIPTPGVEVRASWVTTVKESSVAHMNLRTKTAVGGNPVPYEGFGGDSTIVTTEVRRTINPYLTGTPTWKPGNLSFLHSVDALSLLSGNIISLLKNFKH